MELARSFNELGLKTGYLIREDRFWPQMLDATGSAIVERRLEEKGIHLRKQEGIEEVLGEADALRTGQAAGANMAGGEEKLAGSIAFNLISIYGIPVAGMGQNLAEGEGYKTLTGDYPRGDVYKRLVLKDGKLIGATLIGETAEARSLERLITARVDVSDIRDRLLTEGFDLPAAARMLLEA